MNLWSGLEVAVGARELRESASVIATIFGAELEAMDKHIELAGAGYTFLGAYSPSMVYDRDGNAFPRWEVIRDFYQTIHN